jgi:hypothetical protein
MVVGNSVPSATVPAARTRHRKILSTSSYQIEWTEPRSNVWLQGQNQVKRQGKDFKAGINGGRASQKVVWATWERASYVLMAVTVGLIWRPSDIGREFWGLLSARLWVGIDNHSAFVPFTYFGREISAYAKIDDKNVMLCKWLKLGLPKTRTLR